MKYLKHYEKTVDILASPEEIFDYVDDHLNFSSHMNKSNMMMGGGMMKTEFDQGGGKAVGSHIKMQGSVFGIDIYPYGNFLVPFYAIILGYAILKHQNLKYQFPNRKVLKLKKEQNKHKAVFCISCIEYTSDKIM